MLILECSGGDEKNYLITCDSCGKDETFSGKDLFQVTEYVKEIGWVFIKENEEELHFCSQECYKVEIN